MQAPSRIGKYELEAFLGGNMSHVYRARDTVIGRTVALKILTEAGCEDAEAKARFLTEARVAGNLSHENILQVYDFGEDEQHRPYMVMEFLIGENLGRAIKNGRTGDLKGKLRIALQLARALEYVHASKIIHRDIKPENVHLTSTGVIKLMDFGIAKTQTFGMTRAGYVLGTPYYMAPEQVTGSSITELVDVYAFGILLFELMTGLKPFQGDSVERIFYSILNEPLDLEPLRRVGAPQALCALVAKSTEKSPADRPQGFTPIRAGLEGILADLDPVNSSPSVSRPRPESSPARGRWVWPAALLVMMVAAIAVSRWIAAWWVAAAALALAAMAGMNQTLRFGGFKGWHRAPGGTTLVNQPAQLPEARTEKLNRDLQPEAPEPSPSTAPGEFTRMFHTAPGRGDAIPAPQPPGVPRPETLVARAAEYTQVFKVAGNVPEAAKPQAGGDAVPDVALAVTACQDLTFMGKRFPIQKFPCRIGRPAGDLALSFDSAVSREHAEVDYVNGGFTIQDLGSANGTFVNGRRLQPNRPEPLLFGTRILLGSNTQLTFVSNELTELPDMTGELIGGRYKLSEKLLASAKSVVYRASDNKLPQSALVKILSPRLVHYPGYREQFEREAKVACRLRHPGISRILDYGETELPGDTLVRTLYIAVEYLEGGSLAHRLAAHERFEVPQIAGWLDRLASALSYVHDQPVIHGSIKPSAIVFDSHDNPYLTDFALAVSATDKAQRTVIGSPPFLAPEQWDGEELSPATDQYSLGVLFYLILTGSHPHEGQEHPEVRRRNLLRGPIPAHEMAAQNQLAAVPVEASTVLQRAMSTKPGDRFPNILVFARALGDALTHKSDQAAKRPFVFISYHRETGAAWALLFRNELDREYGCEVFVDTEQRDTAGQFPQKLERNIERCDVFVCLLAQNTLGSMWVNREIELAHRARKPMVPVFQESFCFPKDTDAQPPHVKDLLLFDGVKLLDRQNVFVSATISSLGKAIRHSLPGRAGDAG